MRADTALARYRGAVAVQLRLEGYTYEELAQTLGYTHRSAARKAVMRTIDERAHMAVDAFRVMRYLELDDLQRRSWASALKGNHTSIKRCMNAGSERLRLHGIA